MTIFDKILHNYQQNLPFVAYRKPNKIKVSGLFQKNNTLFFFKNYANKGFVFAPFDDENNAILIPLHQSEFLQEKVQVNDSFTYRNNFKNDNLSKENHIRIVEKAIKEIRNNRLKKVVISRKEEVLLTTFNLIITFKKLLQTYNNAFVYVWFHPKVGLWFGATPETLLKINGNEFKTMALAGTKLYKGTTDVVWQQKEIKEQQFVTEYVVNYLKPLVKKITYSKAQTVKAGNLLHLKTNFSGELKNQDFKLLAKLHPTPAVCGLPLKLAKEFILKNENYNRRFYTGYLGEIYRNSVFYVNLRCMEIINNKAILYMGGGITKESNPQKEWEETVAKAQVMKKIL